MSLITAYRKDTGERVRIPEHFLDHPTLSVPFSREPVEAEVERETDKAVVAQRAAAPVPVNTTIPAKTSAPADKKE